MKIRINIFSGDTDGPFTTRSRFPNDYDGYTSCYDLLRFFYSKYITEALLPIPPDFGENSIAVITREREFVEKRRKWGADVRAAGGYCPDFVDQEIAFLILDNLLVYNAWQSKYKLTHKLLYAWLQEFEKNGIKEDDICSYLDAYPLDKYLEKNGEIIGNDYDYVHHF